MTKTSSHITFRLSFHLIALRMELDFTFWAFLHRSDSVWPICLPPPDKQFENMKPIVIGAWPKHTQIVIFITFIIVICGYWRHFSKIHRALYQISGWGTIYAFGPFSPKLLKVSTTKFSYETSASKNSVSLCYGVNPYTLLPERELNPLKFVMALAWYFNHFHHHLSKIQINSCY